MDDARYRVWCKPGLAYYPVRKAASSSLHLAFGGEPVDMRRVPNGVLSFTMVRNPFDRLASIYANHLEYQNFPKMGIRPGMSEEEFIYRVCESREPFCDQHFWSADWTTPFTAYVYYFEDIKNEFERMNFDLNMNMKFLQISSSNHPERIDPYPVWGPVLEEYIACRYKKDIKRFYENNPTQVGCRSAGKAAAKVRREATERIKRKYFIGGRPPPTDSSSE